ncbi:MAG: hypothetical protein AAF583_04035 [Pseudomonadota bacterium]
MSTNIRPEHVSAFEALTSGVFDNFALFSCLLDGEPAAAIVVITTPNEKCENYEIKLLFVSVTNAMVLTDYDGTAAL